VRSLAILLVSACGASPPAAPAAAPSSGAEPVLGSACAGATLLARPTDLREAGPWPVGARTVRAGDLTLEVWYPAVPGSERGLPRVRYDLREQMPPPEAVKIPDADNPLLPCDCVRDVPLDERRGPYPVVVFFHGAASFRAQSAFLATHWASRGFVVVAPDVEAIGLGAALRMNDSDATPSLPFGVPLRVLETIVHAPGDDDPLAFVRPRMDASRVALAGHSLGSLLAGTVVDRPQVQVRIAMAGVSGAAAAAGDDRASLLVLVGDHDAIAGAEGARASFAAVERPGTSRLAVVKGAGHLAFSDLCGPRAPAVPRPPGRPGPPPPAPRGPQAGPQARPIPSGALGPSGGASRIAP